MRGGSSVGAATGKRNLNAALEFGENSPNAKRLCAEPMSRKIREIQSERGQVASENGSGQFLEPRAPGIPANGEA